MAKKFKTPDDLFDAYSNGFVGAYCNPEHLEKLLSSLPNPTFATAGFRLHGSGAGKLSTPYKSVYKLSAEKPYLERQTTGDCTIQGTLVTMADHSLRAIEDIVVGDYVLSHKNIARKVTATIKKKYTGKLVTIRAKGFTKTLTSTFNHDIVWFPHMTAGKRANEAFKPIGHLNEREKILIPYGYNVNKQDFIEKIDILDHRTENGYALPVAEITYEDVVDHTVYCIEVDYDHTMIANGYARKNCVSHGTRNAVDVSRAVQIDVGRKLESFITIGATEAIYGCRGHGGQGMSCSEAAEFVHKNGGILLRKKYDIIDLSTYNADIGTRWGSSGVPADVKKLAAEHQVKTLTQISTIEQARDALANGYGIAVCSNQGFSSQRDDKGFSKPQGSWSHCMAWTACDDTGSEPAFLVQNSWGKFNDGGHPQWGPIPDGSFLIHADVAARMLKSDSSFAFSAVQGFPPVKLPDYGFEEYL